MKIYTILIVDDQPSHIESIIEYMEMENAPYEFLQAVNGEMALKVVQKRLPDLIISDWEMPKMNGIELIKILKSQSETKDIPIIMCTGVMLTSKDLTIALEAGAVDYIRKPIDKVELFARIRSMLQLSESYKQIKRLNEHKDKIFTIVAHDLKGPVGNIATMIDIMLTQQFNDETFIEFLESARSTISATYGLLQNLFDWANLQRGIFVFSPKTINIEQIINDNVQLLYESASQKNIRLISDCKGELLAWGDYNMIQTIIRNLTANAIKFTLSGGTITLQAIQKHNTVYIAVIDTGIGIRPENITKILDNQVVYTSQGTLSESGSGLGLQICLEFVKQHGSQLNIQSQVERGSIFSFELQRV